MKMNIAEWARHNGLNEDQFKEEMVSIMCAVGSLELDQHEGMDTIIWEKVIDSGYKYSVSVNREMVKKPEDEL